MSKRVAAVLTVVGALGLGATVATGSTGSVVAQDDPVTLTVGLIQDLASPNVSVGYLVSDFELYNLQYATLTDKAAADFATIPGLAESWVAIGRRVDVHVHPARRAQVVGRRTTHRRRHRLHHQPVPRRGVGQPLLDRPEPHGDRGRRPHRRDRQLGARPEVADDGRVHRAQARLREPSRPTTCRPTTASTASRPASTRCRSGVPARTGRW